jgi:hypothetical protein
MHYIYIYIYIHLLEEAYFFGGTFRRDMQVFFWSGRLDRCDGGLAQAEVDLA